MTTFDIAVFTTWELYYHCEQDLPSGDGYEGRDIAAEFIQGAFSKSNQHDINLTKAPERINAPTEKSNDSFTAETPCGTYGSGTWSHLSDWWEFWHEDAACKDPHTHADDVNLLVTDADGGGYGPPTYPTVGGCYHIAANYDSYQHYGFDSAFNKVDSVLEEVGHSLDENLEDKDYQYVSGKSGGDGSLLHDTGDIMSFLGGDTITPMGITGDVDYNNCGKYVNKDGYNPTGWVAEYSDCTEDYFKG